MTSAATTPSMRPVNVIFSGAIGKLRMRVGLI
jgi:hypothetical protein